VLNHYFLTLLVAAVPVIELRGAIPYGIAMGLTPWETFIAAIIGNLLPVPFIMLLIRRIFDFLRKRPFWESKIEHLEKKAHLKGKVVKKYRTPGLILLVAIPLPGTGAWTGALVASLLDIRMRTAIPAIFAGLLIAGIIVLTVSCGVGSLF